MATSKMNVPETPDVLVISHEEYTEGLNKQLEEGKELKKLIISNEAELKTARNEFYSWDNYNTEFFKHSFNVQGGGIVDRYKMVNQSIFGFLGGREPQLSEKISELHEFIDNKTRFLRDCVKSASLLRSTLTAAKK